MKYLIVAATELEIGPLRNFLETNTKKTLEEYYLIDKHKIKILISGIGLISTAISLTKAIYIFQPDYVINMGIAGAFNRNISIGEIVEVESEVFGDLGIDNKGDFEDIFDANLLSANSYPFTNKQLINKSPLKCNLALPQIRKCKGISVNCVSGSADLIKKRSDKFDCDVESMEGAAVHYICLSENIYFLQIRSISNYVEPRNKDNWKIQKAIENLNNYLIKLIESLSYSSEVF